jgi:hypothetical protein
MNDQEVVVPLIKTFRGLNKAPIRSVRTDDEKFVRSAFRERTITNKKE